MRHVSLVIVLAACVASCRSSAPETEYDQCVQRAAQSPTATGVNIASQNCAQRYDREVEYEKNLTRDKSPGAARYIFWDGWKFQQGKVPKNLKDSGYKTHVIGLFGIPVCKVSIPDEMAAEILPEVGDDIALNSIISEEMWKACN